ncbi:hypothetical protein [Alloactinosynnema sp. L-07]|uniref:Gp19/Gp15/Gp42 family protein n=1 Tax=Alloactinosynnema sp. L-07 TaxID=1653480 RepID=UPI00065EFE84|nr:Gp19/Gp15/Gp42 family protein [Alloactinosynnema sp. L-07]CRK55431.1 hypothetical protein [Alloactinosynnema sp. L-07]
MPSHPPLATVVDVQARTDVAFTPEQQSRVAVLIADATALVHARVPGLSSPAPPTAVGVISTAVLRALATPPDGNASETIGAYTRTAAHAGGGLYLTEDELDLLRPPASSAGGAFSIWTA